MPYKPHRTRGAHQVAETTYPSPGVLPTEHKPPIDRYSSDKSHGCIRPRLCKNVFEREGYSKPNWKSRICVKSTSADVPINVRFNVDARTSILTKRFYTLWANSGQSTDQVETTKIRHYLLFTVSALLTWHLEV